MQSQLPQVVLMRGSGAWIAAQNYPELRQASWTFTPPISHSLTLEGIIPIGGASCQFRAVVLNVQSPDQHISFTRELVRNDSSLDLSPDLLNQKLWGWG